MAEDPRQPVEEEQVSEQAPTPPPVLTALLLENFSDSVVSHHTNFGDETVVIKREGLLDLFRFLKDDPRCRFDLMIDLTAADYLPREPRFEVVVHLKSIVLHHRLRVKIPLATDEAELDTISGLWVAADWYERECWDMYGIVFKGHPNLRRLLLYDEFEGHPLRKDYDYYLQQPLVPMRKIRERHDYEHKVITPEGPKPLPS